MLLHHLLSWTIGGDARPLLGGAGGFAVTDLAARRLRHRDGAGTGRVLRRWVVIGAWGVALGAAVDHQVDTIGVLEILAVVGVVVTVVAMVLVPGARVWAAVATALTGVSGLVIDAATDSGGGWEAVFGDRFPLVSYLALAAWGAAVVALLGSRERSGRLVALAGAGVVVVAVLALSDVGVWPADRYPSGPAFIVPGLVGTLLAWAGLAVLRDSAVTRGMERAGRRTLVVFVAHYAVRLVLDVGGWWQELAGPGWIAAAIAGALVIGLASSLPQPVTLKASRVRATG
jgi:hypothetical protein